MYFINTVWMLSFEQIFFLISSYGYGYGLGYGGYWPFYGR
jgi:hypothetical protein